MCLMAVVSVVSVSLYNLVKVQPRQALLETMRG